MIKELFTKFKSPKHDHIGLHQAIYGRFKDYTMIPEPTYIKNLELISSLDLPDGAVIECGVWRGGMIAGISVILGNRNYYLFDSFEGLPQAEEIDGQAAIDWQSNKDDPGYYNNCTAEETYANTLMKSCNVPYQLVKGFFSETLQSFHIKENISVLRLDADWYQSTYDCLNSLYPNVVEGGLILIDDYFAWDGCSKAVHDYLSIIKSNSRIRTNGEICYIIKSEKGRSITFYP